MKKILIIAGPNGAGKTTFAGEFLPKEADCLEFVNADLIAAGLSPFQPEKANFAAGRLMLERIDTLVKAGNSFALETTLATRTYLRLIPRWQQAGYQVILHFLKLPNADFAIRRVDQRVRLGGHSIPRETIRRRFERGWKYLHRDYLELVDEWSSYDASQAPALVIEAGKSHPPQSFMEDPAEYRADAASDAGATTDAAGPAAQHAGEHALDDADLSGVRAALKRAAVVAIKRAREAGIEPVVSRYGDADLQWIEDEAVKVDGDAGQA